MIPGMLRIFSYFHLAIGVFYEIILSALILTSFLYRLAQLSPNSIPHLLDAISTRLQILKLSEANFETEGPTENLGGKLLSPLISEMSVWRGRMGEAKEEHMHLFEKYAMPA